MSYQVRRVPADVTYPLRQYVLRRHQRVEEIRLPGDDDPDTASLAALADDGKVLGTASVRREACPWHPDRTDAWRLRGMATAVYGDEWEELLMGPHVHMWREVARSR